MSFDMFLAIAAITTGIAGLYLTLIVRAKIIKADVAYGNILGEEKFIIKYEMRLNKVRTFCKNAYYKYMHVLEKLYLLLVVIMICIGTWKLIVSVNNGAEREIISALVWILIPLIANHIIMIISIIRGQFIQRSYTKTAAPPISITYRGEGWLPTKVYEGDSQTIKFVFTIGSGIRSSELHHPTKNEVNITKVLDFKVPTDRDTFLEMQLLAA
jgi:hypothetical protein